ncbi:MAG: GNAT family N-acetyltransferase [Calditrichaeota bacterium]|nr:GNAT family N-acetyltransferase [Calditrichota bacterium]
MIDLSDYPKTIKMHDGRSLVVRGLTVDDEKAVAQFIHQLPPAERIYFWDDPADPEVLHSWVQNARLDRVIPMIGLIDGRVVTIWTLSHDQHSWTRHIAYLWGVVDHTLRRMGIGTLMVRETLSIASRLDIERIALELVSPQKGQFAHFAHFGFVVSAILRSWVKDPSGQYHDMVIISMEVEPAWQKMEELILQYDSHAG